MPDVPGSPIADFARLFRGDRFRFEFGIRPADANWFRLAPVATPELEKRRCLLSDQPDRHSPWGDEAAPVLDELLELFAEPEAQNWKGLGAAGARQLAARWEPDFVLLRRGGSKSRMVGACVCDPSWWNPAEKLGLPVEAIHSVVPTLNEELGKRIETFLDRLPAGGAFVRENWGLAAVADRNLHPDLDRPRLSAESTLDQVWLRVEHQAFRSLPRSAGMVFVIWLTVHRLVEVLENGEIADNFRRMLTSMPVEIARYKGIELVRAGLISALSCNDSFQPRIDTNKHE